MDLDGSQRTSSPFSPDLKLDLTGLEIELGTDLDELRPSSAPRVVIDLSMFALQVRFADPTWSRHRAFRALIAVVSRPYDTRAVRFHVFRKGCAVLERIS